jgi:hypothetical protein
LLEVLGEPVGDVHRTVLAAGAAHRDREIAAVGLGKLRDPFPEKPVE